MDNPTFLLIALALSLLGAIVLTQNVPQVFPSSPSTIPSGEGIKLKKSDPFYGEV